jgi:excisionase family DNA binding protein
MSETEQPAWMRRSEWTTDEAAAYLGVSRMRVHQYIHDGRLAAEKRGRDLFVRARDVRHLQRRPVGRPLKGAAPLRPRPKKT